MSVPIPLRGDFNAAQLRGLAKRTKDGPQARRLLALAVIYDGGTRSEAAKVGVSDFRSSAIGYCDLTREGRRACLTAKRLASPRSSTMPSAKLSRG